MKKGKIKNNIVNVMDSAVGNGCNNVDTYSEQCFYKLCLQNDEKIKIFYEWQANKERYIKTTQTIIYDFQNYSMHDKSHSQAVIVAIEKFLGKKRIRKLGIGNLWLLLNAAYGHDVGMSVKNEEVVKLWSGNEGFHEHIKRLANHPELKLQKEARYYLQLHNMLNNQKQMEGMNDDKYKIYELTREWPIQLKKDVVILTNEYIRAKHPDRSKDFLQNFSDAVGIKIAENRLYKVLGEVAYAHNEDYDYISRHLKKEIDGFGDEKIHPQFIASLLRLGDLLDMDNNRFDTYAMAHFGTFPDASQAHLNKHLALTHLLINEKRIEAVEMAEDEETCRISSNWFEMIESEIKNITSNWNNMAPENLGGCTFYECDLKIYLNGQLYKREQHNKLEVNQKKFMDVLIGDKLYDDSFVFMREYIQNAVDATKLMLSIKSQSDWSNNIYSSEEFGYHEPTPLRLNKDYLEELSIIIEFSLTGDIKKGEREGVRIRIHDRGIGMEEECVKVLSVIGNSWRGRTRYQKELNNMPYWLYPTGGFGIGIQSGFMVTDKVKIRTLGLQESRGHIITLTSPREEGEINVLCDRDVRTIGTEVILEISKERFIKCIEQYTNDNNPERAGNQWEYLDRDSFLKKIIKVIEKYVEETITNSLFPIKLKYKGAAAEQEIVLYGKILSVLKQGTDFSYDSEYEYIYAWVGEAATGRKKLCLWACRECFYAEISADRPGEADSFCYRGIQVKNSDKNQKSIVGKLISQQIHLLIDFINSKAEDWLLISRSGFRPEKKRHIIETGNRIFQFYVNSLLHLGKNIAPDDVPVLFLGILNFGSTWEAKEVAELRGIDKTFMASELTYNDGRFDIKQSQGVSIYEIYQLVHGDGMILWKGTVPETDRTLRQRLILENVKEAYEENWGCSPIEQYIRGKLFKGGRKKEENKILFIEDNRIICYLEEYGEREKIDFEIKTRDERIVKSLSCLEWKEEKQDKGETKELIKYALERKYSYLQLNDTAGFEALLLGKLPEGDVSEEFCQYRNVLLMPLSPSALAREKTAFEQEQNYNWKKFWEKLQADEMWLRVVDWTVRHPKNEQQVYNKDIVIEQYKGLCGLVFEIMKEDQAKNAT